MKHVVFWISIVFILCFLTVSPSLAITGNEMVFTDEPRYMKGDIALIYGVGFDPYWVVKVEVERPDGSIVKGDGTETPGSDRVTTNTDGNFVYSYIIDGAPEGTYTVRVKSAATNLILATTTFEDKAQFMLQGCSKHKGDCTQDPSGASPPGWADGASPMDGWTSGVLKGWSEGDDVPYRLRINLPKSTDAGTYYIMNEHDYLRSGIFGIDSASLFYVGVGPSVPSLTEGALTKPCKTPILPGGSSLPGSLPFMGFECIVLGPTFTGVNDDGDGSTDEETPNGIDDDFDGKIDEDSIKLGGPGNPAQRIQYTWAVKFNASEAGDNDKKWAFYWKGHLAPGSSGFPGASLHTNTSGTGAQDVPIMVSPATVPADVFIQKHCVPIDPEGIQPGKHIKCTLTYGNTGGSDALGVMIVDDYDETYVDNRPGNTPTNITGGGVDDGDKITWSIGTVAAMSGPFTQMYEYRIHDETPDTEAHMPVGDGLDNDGDTLIDEEILNGVDDDGDFLIDEDTGDTNIINKATISTTSTETDLSDNMALEDILVHAEPNLFVVKMVNMTTVHVGDIITITLNYGNANHSDAPNVLLCDDYNQIFMQPIVASISGGGVDNGDKICWGFGVTPPGTLPGTFPLGTDTLPGLDPVVSYQATILIPPPNTTTDTATISTSDPEPPFKLGDNTSSITLINLGRPPKPTAIRLLFFKAVTEDGQMQLTWATGVEIDNLGFNILRSSFPQGSFVKINAVMIPARAISPAGATYTFVDSSVENGKTYYYQLEDIDIRGMKTAHNPVLATPMFAGVPLLSDTSTASLQPQAPLGAIESPSAPIPGQPTFFFQVQEDRDNTLEVARQQTQEQEESASKEEAVSRSISFKAISSDGQITLEWTSSDPEEQFNILRSETDEGEYVQINGAVLSVPDKIAEGIAYTYTDTTVGNGTTYYYKLERITVEGKNTFIGPIPATPNLDLSQLKMPK